MEKEIKEFLKFIIDAKLTSENETDFFINEIKKRAKDTLDESFKKEVIGVFEYKLSNDPDVIYAVKNNDIAKFCHETYYYDNCKDFINDNYDSIDEIMKILREYLKEQEKENE